jgi:phosphoribosylformylglycinamidine (FGAM) synthase-like amidotransferase family enzyme
MAQRKPRALVFSGDGLHGDVELAAAFEAVGFDVDIRTLNELMVSRVSQEEFTRRWSVLGFPGGASFGDTLGGGKIFALKFDQGLGWDLRQYAERGGLVLGVGNGFQTLLRLELFGSDLTLTRNESGQFQNQWVRVVPHAQRCIWLKSLGTLELPTRHAEGRMMMLGLRRPEILSRMARQGMMCLTYEGGLQGSEKDIAGLCDPTGRIFGLMPHPECFLRWSAYPEWTGSMNRANSPGQGLAIFENGYQEAMRVL